MQGHQTSYETFIPELNIFSVMFVVQNVSLQVTEGEASSLDKLLYNHTFYLCFIASVLQMPFFIRFSNVGNDYCFLEENSEFLLPILQIICKVIYAKMIIENDNFCSKIQNSPQRLVWECFPNTPILAFDV